MIPKLRISSLILIFLSNCFLLPAQDEGAAEPVKDPYIGLTKKFVGAVKRNEFHKNYHFFDTGFYGKMIEAQVRKSVDDFIKENGNIVAVEKTIADTFGCKMVTATAIRVNKGKYLWYTYFDQGQKIQRLQMDTFRKENWFYNLPADAFKNYSRTEIRIEPNAFIGLPGYLYVPKNVKRPPLVILVHGSGPQDRHLSIGQNKIYFDIALQLMAKGIAVMVYDKRTYVYQFKDPFPMDSMDYNTETVEDAVAAFKLSKGSKEIDTSRIFIAGHSQGALCAPLIAKQCKGLKGLILLAAPGRNLLEIMPEQLDYISSLKTGAEKEEFDKTANIIKWQVKNAMDPALNLKSKKILPFGAKAKYWLFDRNYKVLDEAKQLKLPIVLLQGGRDYNVTKKDYDLWTSAMSGKTNFKSFWLEDLDHCFFEGNGTARPEDLEKAQHVSPKVTTKMADFINTK